MIKVLSPNFGIDFKAVKFSFFLDIISFHFMPQGPILF